MSGLLALSRGIDRINAFIGRAVSWLILVAVLVSAGNAIIRKVLNISSNAWLELQWYLYGAAFLGAAALTLLENEHIRIDILHSRRSRRGQLWTDLVGHVLFLLPFLGVTIWFMLPWVRNSMRSGEHSMNWGGLVLWPAKLMLLVGFSLLALQALSEIIKTVAILTGRLEDHRRGDPVVLDLDPEALAEAGFDATLPGREGAPPGRTPPDEEGRR